MLKAKKLVKRVARKLKMESSKAQHTPPVQQLCSEEDGSRQPCALPSPDLFNQQKSATLPCMATCSLYSVCSDTVGDGESPRVTFTRQNVSILSSDSGLGTASEDEMDDVFSDSEDEDIQSMVEDDSWWIDGSQISLKKVLNSSSCETVYR